MLCARKLLVVSIVVALAPAVGWTEPSLSVTSLDKTLQLTVSGNAWIEVDPAVFQANIRTLQRNLVGKSQLCAIMKADAYGHGIGLLMPSIIAAGVPCVGIASNEEARIVREKGFRGRLMRVRTATAGEIEDGLKYDMEELVGNLDLATIANEIAFKQHSRLRVHLALNSAGMSRNGIELKTEQGKRDAIALLKLPSLDVVGIMTHYPVDEEEDVRRSLAAFKSDVDWVVSAGHLDRSKLTLHCANSFATIKVPETHLDMVRVGGALYGDGVPDPAYRRVMQFKTRVVSVNAYPKGNTVNYDRTYQLDHDALLANLPVGYSDGYRRIFSSKEGNRPNAYVLVHGQRAPVVGRVTMNTTMVDVTAVKGPILPGDEVVLYGEQNVDGFHDEITEDEIEKSAGTILDDLSTVWGNSNPRIVRTTSAR